MQKNNFFSVKKFYFRLVKNLLLPVFAHEQLFCWKGNVSQKNNIGPKKSKKNITRKFMNTTLHLFNIIQQNI